MKEFPRFVFTSPGNCNCLGGTYGYELVQDETELKAALDAGFFETVPEALNPPKKVEKAPKGAKQNDD
jgi:hypothetical protein